MTRLIPACCVGAFFALAGNVLLAETVAESGQPLMEWNVGHGDIGLAFEDGELELHYHFEDGLNGVPPEIELEPNEAYVRVSDASKIQAPGPVDFLGVNTGEDIWILPQSGTVADDNGLPFVGIAIEELAGIFDSAVFTMTGFDGPGEFALWQDGLTPTVFMQTIDGIGSDDNFAMSFPLDHDHANWGFTQEGVYDIELTATAGGATDVATFQFAVGSSTAIPEPGSFATLATLSVVGFGLSRRRRRPQASVTVN